MLKKLVSCLLYKSMKNLIILLILTLIFSCSNTDNDINKEIEQIEEIEIIPTSFTENVEVYNEELVHKGYVLAVYGNNDTSYLLDKGGNIIKEWPFDSNTGNDVELLTNGKLIGIFKIDNPPFTFGGYGGVIKILNIDGVVEWEYTFDTSLGLAHHDVEMLPNGNVLFLVWEEVDNITAQNNGAITTNNIYPEALIEVNPKTNNIEWEWHSKDHFIQDTNTNALNFGNVSENPQLIDINYNVVPNGDIMHANGINYDPNKDVIYLSVNFYDEVWVIDHSTTSTQAALHTGGNYNKGGDLLYRFGNPEAYKNSFGTRLFYNNHTPELLKNDVPGAGNFLIYNNGNNNSQSIVYELEIPDSFNLLPNSNNEPPVVWSFSNPDLHYQRVSGADRLPNGNTLICEGDYGFWEVTIDGEIVWKYATLSLDILWRGYGFSGNNDGILNLDL